MQVAKLRAMILGLCLVPYVAEPAIGSAIVGGAPSQSHSSSSGAQSRPASRPPAGVRQHPSPPIPNDRVERPGPAGPDRSLRPSPSFREPSALGVFPRALMPAAVLQLRISSVTFSKSAEEAERQARWRSEGEGQESNHQEALRGYLQALNKLQQTESTLAKPLGPGTRVPQAKAELDVAREFASLNKEKEAREHVRAAHGLLLEMANRPLDRRWRWRILYFLGDVNIYEGDTEDAAYYYQQAADLEPDFVPASALVHYVRGDVAPVPEVPPTSTPQPATLVPEPAPSPSPQPNVTVGGMLDQLRKIGPVNALQIAAGGLGLAAAVFGIAELGAAGALVSLAGLVVQNHCKATSPDPSKCALKFAMRRKGFYRRIAI